MNKISNVIDDKMRINGTIKWSAVALRTDDHVSNKNFMNTVIYIEHLGE